MKERLIFDEHDRIAVIAPHPDDECLGAAAALILAPDRTDIYVLTDGSHGNSNVSVEEEAGIRKAQFEAEMEFVKPHAWKWLGYEDTSLSKHPDAADEIDFTPYTKIFLPWNKSLHPDHRTAAVSCCRAIRRQKAQADCFMYEITAPFYNPTHYIDITGILETKRQMIRFHKDQYEQEDINTSLNRLRGAQLISLPDCKYAECYLKVDARMYGYNPDLIAKLYTLRENPGLEASLEEKGIKIKRVIPPDFTKVYEFILKHTGLDEEILHLDPEQRRAAVSDGLREAEGKDPDVTAASAAGGRILMDEYLDLAMDLNDMSMKSFLMEKINLFSRPGLRDYMCRPALDLSSASDEAILQFLQTWGKTAGKRNTVAGDGFQIYMGSGMDLVQKIRSDGVDLLEPYIYQHQAYQAIYPDSLNTIRIHTVRSSHEVKTFMTVILSVGGDGAVVDVSNSTTRYRVLLSEDGSIMEAFRQDPKEPCKITQRHHNTGYPFRHGRKLPGIPACLEFCRKAAFYIPEMRYIGWDVAVTEQGPVIVEANNVSGSIYTYQQAKECITGAGVRDEVEELLAFGMEGVRYNERMIYISEPLVRTGVCLPDVRSLYLTLLQSALHRHGVEFYEREFIKSRSVERKHCSIRYLEENHAVQIELEGRTELICQPEVEKPGLSPYGEDKEHPCISEADFFALDQIAMQEAARIYRVLTHADAGSSADHISRQEEAP